MSESYFGDLATTDSNLLSVADALKNSRYKPDLSLLKEIRSFLLTSDRLCKQYKNLLPDEFTTLSSLTALIQAFKTVMAMRDRTTEVRLSCIRPRAQLNHMQEQVTAYILKFHMEQLAKFKTVSDRDIVLRSLVPDIQNFRNKYDVIIETCDLVLVSLKDTHFALVEIEKLATICYDGRISNRKAEHA